MNILIFQFHKGTIRTFRELITSGGVGNFNSIKVQLELGLPAAFVERAAFQFHKGTIRTRRVASKPRASNSFQFHKGTIRTYAVSCLPRRVVLISIP